jgi:hypothetical protein
MRRIDYATLSKWCTDQGYELREWVPALPNPARTMTSRMFDNVQLLPEFLDILVNIADTERLVWIRDWTIWNERSQDLGLRCLDLLTANLPESERAIDSHAYLLGAAEWREAIALLLPPILFGWDAHLLFRSGALAVNVSHHGRIDLSFSNESATWAERLSRWCEMA